MKVEQQTEETSTVTRVVLNQADLENFTKEQFADAWKKQELYIDSLQQKVAYAKGTESNNEKELETKVQQALNESSRKDNLMNMRIIAKEQEMQELVNQMNELKNLNGRDSSLRISLLDPAVNYVIEKLKKELEQTKSKLEETQNELSAWKFTPDSQTGKRLMAKCRLLYQENEDLGKVISSGNLAKLEAELALQKNLAEEMKKSQSEMDDFVTELDEDVEGMQSTIYFLQEQLRETKAQLEALGRAGPNGNDTVEMPSPQEEEEVKRKIATDEAVENGHTNIDDDANVDDDDDKLRTRTGTKRELVTDDLNENDVTNTEPSLKRTRTEDNNNGVVTDEKSSE